LNEESRRIILLLCTAVHICPCTSNASHVILVSFDGFRNDYKKLYNPPNFVSFASQGAEAEGLIPSFPSKTFPNHYTLVTGLYPGHHGLVDNSFYDPDRKEYYSMKMKNRVQDPTITTARRYGNLQRITT
jgi:alkaline phosphatase D